MKYADRTNFMKASEIRELLKLTEDPEIISFGGGMPSPKAFPDRKSTRLNSSHTT
jgi:2-aminoadipate transaminase